MDFILLLIALVVFVVGTLQAQTLTLPSQTQHIDSQDHVEFLEDTNGSLSIPTWINQKWRYVSGGGLMHPVRSVWVTRVPCGG
jgi:hypothetical protein